ncbi:ribosomal protein L10e/L16 [Melampsora americana]|nr:ribosomal protein L10e/L16 [Melampsora americana]
MLQIFSTSISPHFSSIFKSSKLIQTSSHPISKLQIRSRGDLAPKRFKYRKAFKGRIPIRTGGSIVATTLEHGQFGLRALEACRLSAKTLQSCETAIKKAIKSAKGSKCYLRVFPDLPVCVKGNETRMGKGKGPFEFWACRVPVGRVLFEVGGGRIQKELAFAALQHAKPRLPIKTEFIDRDSKARLGNLLIEKPPKTQTLHSSSSSSSSSSASSFDLNETCSKTPLDNIGRMLESVRESRKAS